MTALPETYDTAATEKKWQAHWLEQKTYAWDQSVPRAESYVIDTPPPTVSGTLHMGHVFSYTQADFIARFQRMSGKNVFYPMGFDDNGLPTERLVEKTIKKRATDMSREEFIAECLKVSEDARKEFRDFFNAIALSVDWAQEYHTISDDVRRLSQLSFLDLVKKEHVYRALKPFYWDPVDQTAIAQAEIVDKELPSHFTDIAFTCETTGEELVIGTTRPELIPACVALFFHPEDARYAKHKGHRAKVPLCDYSVPILTDDSVEMDKGTGLMMCCTFGDEKDIAKWQKHKLDTRVILNKYGKMDFASVTLPAALTEALKAKKVSNPDPKNLGARETILALLNDAGLVRKQDAIKHMVKTAERSGAPLEILPTHQWFVKLLDKKDALKAKSKECAWHPEWMALRMEQWIDGLNQDWCISRQRYFGVPFPVWYVCKYDGAQPAGAWREVYASPKDLPINPTVNPPAVFEKLATVPITDTSKSDAEREVMLRDPHMRAWLCKMNGDYLEFKQGEEVLVRPDLDVMDTWATSSISPQISAHGISKELTSDAARFNALYPADLRPQAHEIIRTWAFYTLVKSYLHNASIPWKNLMISGWCLAEDKSKMSKSKGNVVTPVALIEEKGTDAVRYWAATSRLGQDTAFSPDLLKIGKKLVTKLWNATSFAAIHLSKLEQHSEITETLDQWIISRLRATVQKATDAFAAYEYADALDATNQFFWADFCDNYLELVKRRVYNEDNSFSATQQQSAVRTLLHCLDAILKLYAPFTPHVTEELYSHLFADEYEKTGSLHARGQWPLAEHYKHDEKALVAGNAAVAILEAIRKAKSERNVSIKFPLDRVVVHPLVDDAARIDFTSLGRDIEGAGSISELVIAKEAGEGVRTLDERFTLALTFAAQAQSA